MHAGMDMDMGVVMVTAMGTLLSHFLSHLSGTHCSIAVLHTWPCVSVLAVVELLVVMLLIVVTALCVCSHMAAELRPIGALSRPIE